MIEIVRSDFNSNSIAGNDANLITTHLSSESALNRVIHVVDLHEKRPAHFFRHCALSSIGSSFGFCGCFGKFYFLMLSRSVEKVDVEKNFL